MNGAADHRLTVLEALETLGLRPGATPDAIAAAFRSAAKQAHPDTGGDAAALRRVVAAYRLLETERPPPPMARQPTTQPPAAPAPLEISPAEALCGGPHVVRLPDGREVSITLPPGLRAGDRLRFAGVVLTVAVRREAGVLVERDHVHLTVSASPDLMREGGRLEVQTPTGPRTVWVSREAGARGLVRVPDQGLPARGAHRRGDLFVRLQPDPGRPESAARAKRRSFAAAWAA